MHEVQSNHSILHGSVVDSMVHNSPATELLYLGETGRKTLVSF